MQYKAALPTTEAIKEASRTNLCEQLGWKSLNADVSLEGYGFYSEPKHLLYQSIFLNFPRKPISKHTHKGIHVAVKLTYSNTAFFTFSICEQSKLEIKTLDTECTIIFIELLLKKMVNHQQSKCLKFTSQLVRTFSVG